MRSHTIVSAHHTVLGKGVQNDVGIGLVIVESTRYVACLDTTGMSLGDLCDDHRLSTAKGSVYLPSSFDGFSRRSTMNDLAGVNPTVWFRRNWLCAIRVGVPRRVVTKGSSDCF
jgi:hypothetical protein